MRVFLSYASEQRQLVESVFRLLEAEGHDVFFDRVALAGGDRFGQSIAQAIERADVFIFFVSRRSVIAPNYALAELRLLEQIPPRRRPFILPVRTDDTPIADIPAALRAVTILEPEGDVGAEITASVRRVGRKRRQRRVLRVSGTLLVLSAVAVLVYVRPLRYRASTSGPDPIADLAAQVRQRTAGREVSLQGMPNRDGWTLLLEIPDLTTKEVFYQLDGDSAYKTTGLSDRIDSYTGAPQPNYQIELSGPFGQAHDVAVKYVTIDGKEHGPFHVQFDPKLESVRIAKMALSMAGDWVVLESIPNGQVWLGFGSLAAWKDAFREIRYSIDSDKLDRRLKFTTKWDDATAAENGKRDEMDFYLPSAQFVTVKLFFVDGTESESKRFAARKGSRQ